MSNHQRLFGYAAILFGLGFFVRSFQPANAYVPVGMQWDSFPYESFSHMDGSLPNPISNGTTHNVLTVPADRIFIVTGMLEQSSYSRCRIYVDGSAVRGGANIFRPSYPNMFTNGNAHLVIPSSSTLQVYANAGDCHVQHLEGYYAHVPS